MINRKKAAMEMSVGTIVTIVLLMSVLVLGIVLVQKIFGSARDAVDLTDSQLKEEINKLFSEEKKLVIYPGTTSIEMERGEKSGIGIGVINRLSGGETADEFEYEVFVSDNEVERNCGIDDDEVQDWIQGGSGEAPLPYGNDIQVEKVLFNIPENSPLCAVKIRVTITIDGNNYDSDSFFLVTD